MQIGASEILMRDVALNLDALIALCHRHGIIRLSLFGSILTDRFGPDSDVDFLIEFDPIRRISLFGLGGITLDFEQVIGRRVDLRSYEDLSKYFRDDVRTHAKLLYAA